MFRGIWNVWAGSVAIVHRKVSRFLEPHFCSALSCCQDMSRSHSLAQTHSLVFSLSYTISHTERVGVTIQHQEYNCVVIKGPIVCSTNRRSIISFTYNSSCPPCRKCSGCLEFNKKKSVHRRHRRDTAAASAGSVTFVCKHSLKTSDAHRWISRLFLPRLGALYVEDAIFAAHHGVGRRVRECVPASAIMVGWGGLERLVARTHGACLATGAHGAMPRTRYTLKTNAWSTKVPKASLETPLMPWCMKETRQPTWCIQRQDKPLDASRDKTNHLMHPETRRTSSFRLWHHVVGKDQGEASQKPYWALDAGRPPSNLDTACSVHLTHRHHHAQLLVLCRMSLKPVRFAP